jgi:hypothetical protein
MQARTQEMLRIRATTKERLRAQAQANRWTLAEAADAAVDALEKFNRAARRPSRRRQAIG